MTISLAKQIQIDATKSYEMRIANIPIIIKRKDAVVRYLNSYRRENDPKPKIRFISPTSLYVTVTVIKYDPKLFWLMAEAFFDVLELDMSEASEARYSSYHELYLTANGVLYNFDMSSIFACRPIYGKKIAQETTEIIGYTCD